MDRLLVNGKDTSIENLVSKINEIVGKKFAILDEKDDIEKWNGIPRLMMLDEIAQKRFISFVDYMDSLLIPIEDKAMLVVSLSGIMQFTNIKLYDYDDGNLFTMADFYQNSSIEDITNTIQIISNINLLNTVRTKTLDLEERTKILLNVLEVIKKNNPTAENINNLIADEINKIKQ